MEIEKTQKVESVERALSLLDAFDEDHSRLSLTELAERTGLYRSTVLRLSSSLERFGFLRRNDDGKFKLGSRLLYFGALYQASFDMEDDVRAILKALSEETGETAAFYVQEGWSRVCLYRHHSQNLVRIHLEEGCHLPLDLGASARVLVAYAGRPGNFHERIRSTGFYVSYGERDAEAVAIAAPVFCNGNKFIGALGLTSPRDRFNRADKDLLIGTVVRGAKDLSARLGSTVAKTANKTT